MEHCQRMRQFGFTLLIWCDICIWSGTKGEITDSVDLTDLNSYEMLANDAVDDRGGRTQSPPPKDLECYHCSTVSESDDCYNATALTANYGANASLAAVLPHRTCTDEAPYCQVRNRFCIFMKIPNPNQRMDVAILRFDGWSTSYRSQTLKSTCPGQWSGAARRTAKTSASRWARGRKSPTALPAAQSPFATQTTRLRALPRSGPWHYF